MSLFLLRSQLICNINAGTGLIVFAFHNEIIESKQIFNKYVSNNWAEINLTERCIYRVYIYMSYEKRLSPRALQ